MTHTTAVIDCEQYKLPLAAVPLKPLTAAYLRWSIGKELRDLRTLVLRGATVTSRAQAAS